MRRVKKLLILKFEQICKLNVQTEMGEWRCSDWEEIKLIFALMTTCAFVVNIM